MIFIFEIIFRNYKLNLLYKTNAKRKEKKENFLRLNNFFNRTLNRMRLARDSINENETNLIVSKLKIE